MANRSADAEQEALASLLTKLKKAHALLVNKWDRRKEITSLGTQVDRKVALIEQELSRQGWPPRLEPEDALGRYGRMSELPEQKEINRTYRHCKRAQAIGDELWSAIQGPLDHFRSAETGELFDALDRLSGTGPAIMQRRIALVDKILSRWERAPATGQPKTLRPRAQEAALRRRLQAKVRKLATERFSHAQIAGCLSLEGDRFPPGVNWVGNDWSEALKGESRRAVSKWLSTAIHGR